MYSLYEKNTGNLIRTLLSFSELKDLSKDYSNVDLWYEYHENSELIHFGDIDDLC
jgi:hypothetical protein